MFLHNFSTFFLFLYVSWLPLVERVLENQQPKLPQKGRSFDSFWSVEKLLRFNSNLELFSPFRCPSSRRHDKFRFHGRIIIVADKISSINDELFSRVDFNVLFWDHRNLLPETSFFYAILAFPPLLGRNKWNIFVDTSQPGLGTNGKREKAARVF